MKYLEVRIRLCPSVGNRRGMLCSISPLKLHQQPPWLVLTSMLLLSINAWRLLIGTRYLRSGLLLAKLPFGNCWRGRLNLILVTNLINCLRILIHSVSNLQCNIEHCNQIATNDVPDRRRLKNSPLILTTVVWLRSRHFSTGSKEP